MKGNSSSASALVSSVCPIVEAQDESASVLLKYMHTLSHMCCETQWGDTFALVNISYEVLLTVF